MSVVLYCANPYHDNLIPSNTSTIQQESPPEKNSSDNTLGGSSEDFNKIVNVSNVEQINGTSSFVVQDANETNGLEGEEDENDDDDDKQQVQLISLNCLVFQYQLQRYYIYGFVVVNDYSMVRFRQLS